MFVNTDFLDFQIWNLENFLPIQNLQRHEGSVNAILVYNDLVISSSDDSEIKVCRLFFLIFISTRKKIIIILILPIKKKTFYLFSTDI